MSTNKTMPTGQGVDDFLAGLSDERQRKESYVLIDLMRRVTGEEPVMWGASIIGFGSYHYVYESGHEGDAILAGFSPRSGKFAVYIMAGFDGYPAILERLGKYKTGKSCLYVKRLDDIHLSVLEELVAESVSYMRERYG
jgi:hypothetical protein